LIDPAQIPDEVVEALHASLADDAGALVPKSDCCAAIAAALAAWPDAFITKYSEGAPAFNLPLPQEASDE